MFAGLLDEGPTEAAYANTVMAQMSEKEQGTICEAWARQTLEERHPEWEILDPEPGADCNGRTRGNGQAPYDFLLNGQKVEIKSARMTWNLSKRKWGVRFWHVHMPIAKRKKAHFDDLYLVLASPSGLCLVKHDFFTGACSDGKRTESTGHTINIAGSVGDTCWEEALSTILEKLCRNGKCELLARGSFGDVCLKQLLATHRNRRDSGQTVYESVPFSNMSSAKRGLRLQEMAFAIDQKLNLRSTFSLLTKEPTRAGRLRATCNASADWTRDLISVEIKTSKLGFDKRKQRWHCFFQCLKPNLFNELWLAIYCPWGVRFYTCSSVEGLRLCTSGSFTKDIGLQLAISGPVRCEDPLGALETIEKKLLSRGCTPHAIVEW